MRKFLDNNITSAPFHDNPQFVNVIEYLNESFQKNSLIIYTKNESDIIDIKSLTPLRSLVFLDVNFVENNLRMIESYLPEIFFAISIVSNKEASVNEIIEKISRQKFPYTKRSFSKTFLQHKIIQFIEAILFADIFNEVWNGQIQSEKCYVYKGDPELEYYQYYQIRPLLFKLFDKISISNEIGKGYRKISFQLKN